jgi:hypothetical protein
VSLALLLVCHFDSGNYNQGYDGAN